MEYQTVCPFCKTNLSSVDFFCPVCGKKLKEKPQSTSLTKQILIYLLSAFLPPLGIWPALKYLRQPDEKSKKIGMIAISLTIISIIFSIWLSVGFLKSFQKSIDTQLVPYGIGF
jgi:hypothetical protein